MEVQKFREDVSVKIADNHIVQYDDELFLNAKTLPDIVLLKIFGYLQFWEICKSGEVCKRWYHLSRAVIYNLKSVDLSEKWLSYFQLEKLIPHLPTTTRFLHLTASCSFGKKFITPYLLRLLAIKCPVLQTLILDGAFIAKDPTMTDINLEDIPESVTALSFRKGFFHADQFLYYSPTNDTLKNRKFSNISRLDLGGSWCIDDNDVPFLTRLPNLNELHLNNCEYISIRGIYSLGSCILGANLRVLNLEDNFGLSDFFSVLSRNCPNLEKLYLANTGFLEVDLDALRTTPLIYLKDLCFRGLPFSDKAVPNLVLYQKNITWLNVSETKVTKNGVKTILELLPKCKVINNLTTSECEHFLPN